MGLKIWQDSWRRLETESRLYLGRRLETIWMKNKETMTTAKQNLGAIHNGAIVHMCNLANEERKSIGLKQYIEVSCSRIFLN